MIRINYCCSHLSSNKLETVGNGERRHVLEVHQERYYEPVFLNRLSLRINKTSLLIIFLLFLFCNLVNLSYAATSTAQKQTITNKSHTNTKPLKKNKRHIKHSQGTKHKKLRKVKHIVPTFTNPTATNDRFQSTRTPRLYSYSALAMDANSGEVLVSKRPAVRLPIASITKLMTAMVTLDSNNDLDDYVTITNSDIDTLKNTFSRLKVGMQFRRRDLLLLALMSSENRAAHALARTSYTGGIKTFIQKMNQKAKTLGMLNTQFYDPTGLTVANQSTAEDLSKMVQASFEYDIIRQDTTTKDADVMLGRNYIHRYMNSDALVRTKKFHISLSKTGYINESGHCLVLYSIVNRRPIVMIFLNSAGKGGRLIDALTVKNYINQLS